MKNISKKIILIALSFSSLNAGIFDYLPFDFGKKKSDDQSVILTPGIQEKQHQLNILKKDKESLESSEKEFIDNIQVELNAVNKRIDEIKEKLKNSSADGSEYLNKILSKLNELSQILIDTQIKRKNFLNIVLQHIELLEAYIKDPGFKCKSFEAKSSYNFESFEKLQKDICFYQEDANNLIEEKAAAEQLLESSKKDLVLLEKDLKAREREQKRFSTAKGKEDSKDKLTLNQKGELIDLDIQILNSQKRFNELKIKDLQQQISLLNTKIFISESVYKLLKGSSVAVEKALWISDSDVEHFNKALADKKRESTELQAKYSDDIRKISQEREKYKQEFERLSKKYKAQDIKNISDWSVDQKTLETEKNIFELGYLNDRIATLDRGTVLKDSQREYEKERIKAEEILGNIIEFWNKISQRKFKVEDEIENERKKFELFKDELTKDVNTYKDKINTVTNFVNSQSKIHNNILEKLKLLSDNSEKFGQLYGEELFNRNYTILTKSEEQVRIQSELNNKIVENYSNIISLAKDLLQKINYILPKVENISGILLRSKYAISWDNVKNILPDLKLYTTDLQRQLKLYFTGKGKNSLSSAKTLPKDFSRIWQIITEIILIFLLYFLLKKMLPYIYFLLLSARPTLPGVNFVNYLFALLIGFVVANFTGIYIWSLIFFLTKIGFISNAGIKSLFYLLSIPYLCYLANKFIDYLIQFNKKHNYPLLNATFQDRFIYVFSFFIYSTIIIFFFNEAFTAVTYGKSELPTILLAIYSIIFRASLIFLIGKEEILSLIPERPGFWTWVRAIINRFYYLLLVTIIIIMIVSDPYIGGFSRLVSYVLWGIVYTILLVTALWWLQILIRRLSSTIFFKSEEDEATKERFHYAKTFYGLFSVLSFTFFVLLAIFIGAKIWNVPVSLEKITEFSNVTIFSVKGEADQLIPITLKSFIVLFTFLFFGFILAWAFDRFVLRRIFNILLVDQGVQNTVSSITYYFIVLVILLVGLLRIGLSGLIPFLVGALAVGLAFAIKGPANDFIGYFVILVERSIKIGDYVEIDENARGVVRKITPRSVVIRRRNSVSVIIPNSRITSEIFYNWNYTPGFSAFDDILLTVPFNADPEEVAKILTKVVSSNINILKSPAPIIWLDNFSENGYVFRVRGYISSINILNQWEIASNIRIAMVKALRERDIQIAAPVRRVLMQDDKLLKN